MPTRFHVRMRDGWEPTDDAPAFQPKRPGRDTVVARFATAADAFADRDRREAEARSAANPFRLNGPNVFYQTSLDPPRLLDWLLDHDLPLPAEAGDGFDYADWFDRIAPQLTATHRAAVWAACDKLRFYEVTEEGRTAYAVLELIWGGIDVGGPVYTAVALPEGGRLIGLFADPRAAQRFAARRNREVRDEPPFGEHVLEYDLGELRDPDKAPLPADETTFTEILEVPLDGPSLEWIVHRSGYESGGGFPSNADGEHGGARVPLRAFADSAAAETFRDSLEADARRTVNPFRTINSHGYWQHALFEQSEDRLPNGRTLDAAVLSVRKLNLDPRPPANVDEWIGWYDQAVGGLTVEQIAAVWAAFAGFRLFEVQAAPDV